MYIGLDEKETERGEGIRKYYKVVRRWTEEVTETSSIEGMELEVMREKIEGEFVWEIRGFLWE